MNNLIENFLDNNFLMTYAPWISWKELKFGLEKGFIDKLSIIKFASDTLQEDSSSKHFELAMLQSNELYEVDILLDHLISMDKGYSSDDETWLYLLLQLLFDYRNDEDPFSFIEELYADFGYPSEIENIVRYMPLPDGKIGSEEYLYQNWKNYLELAKDQLARMHS